MNGILHCTLLSELFPPNDIFETILLIVVICSVQYSSCELHVAILYLN